MSGSGAQEPAAASAPAWTTLVVGSAAIELRRATPADLPALVALLADDAIGAGREVAGGDLAPYRTAFDLVDRDPAHVLVVAEARETEHGAVEHGAVVGTLQLSFIPGLSRHGALRAQIEGVRVRSDHRGSGLGAAMIEWSLGEARRRGCALVQLTTDRRRSGARRFYERLGFVASHDGMKLAL